MKLAIIWCLVWLGSTTDFFFLLNVKESSTIFFFFFFEKDSSTVFFYFLWSAPFSLFFFNLIGLPQTINQQVTTNNRHIAEKVKKKKTKKKKLFDRCWKEKCFKRVVKIIKGDRRILNLYAHNASIEGRKKRKKKYIYIYIKNVIFLKKKKNFPI